MRQFWPVENTSGVTVACWDAINQCYAPITLCNGNGMISNNPWAIPMVFGEKMKAITIRKGNDLKLSKALIDQAVRLIPFRSSMLAFLSSTGRKIAIENRNNMFEIMMHYAKFHPMAKGKLSNDAYNVALGRKNRVERIDWGSIFGAVGDIVGGIVGAANQGSVNAFIANWATAFRHYMVDIDFPAIQATLNATQERPGAWGGWGVKGALDMIRQYKRTSWADLRATIEEYCARNNAAVPDSVKQLFRQQDQLEQDLVNMQQTHTGNTGGTTTNNNAPVINNNTLMKWAPYVVIILIVLVGLNMMGGRR